MYDSHSVHVERPYAVRCLKGCCKMSCCDMGVTAGITKFAYASSWMRAPKPGHASKSKGMRFAKRYTLIPCFSILPPMLTAASTMKAWPSNTCTSPVHAGGCHDEGHRPGLAYFVSIMCRRTTAACQMCLSTALLGTGGGFAWIVILACGDHASWCNSSSCEGKTDHGLARQTTRIWECGQETTNLWRSQPDRAQSPW